MCGDDADHTHGFDGAGCLWRDPKTKAQCGRLDVVHPAMPVCTIHSGLAVAGILDFLFGRKK